jgi:hypothetical protein
MHISFSPDGKFFLVSTGLWYNYSEKKVPATF